MAEVRGWTTLRQPVAMSSSSLSFHVSWAVPASWLSMLSYCTITPSLSHAEAWLFPPSHHAGQGG